MQSPVGNLNKIRIDTESSFNMNLTGKPGDTIRDDFDPNLLKTQGSFCDRIVKLLGFLAKDSSKRLVLKFAPVCSLNRIIVVSALSSLTDESKT